VTRSREPDEFLYSSAAIDKISTTRRTVSAVAEPFISPVAVRRERAGCPYHIISYRINYGTSPRKRASCRQRLKPRPVRRSSQVRHDTTGRAAGGCRASEACCSPQASVRASTTAAAAAAGDCITNGNRTRFVILRI